MVAKGGMDMSVQQTYEHMGDSATWTLQMKKIPDRAGNAQSSILNKYIISKKNYKYNTCFEYSCSIHVYAMFTGANLLSSF